MKKLAALALLIALASVAGPRRRLRDGTFVDDQPDAGQPAKHHRHRIEIEDTAKFWGIRDAGRLCTRQPTDGGHCVTTVVRPDGGEDQVFSRFHHVPLRGATGQCERPFPCPHANDDEGGPE